LCGAQAVGATRATGMTIALTLFAQLNDEGIHCNILLFMVGTLVSSPLGYLSFHTPSLLAI
jgi:hypothetical protein